MTGIFNSIARSQWFFMGLLMTNVAEAQRHAEELKLHLESLPIGGGNAFEQYINGDPVLVKELRAFATARPPTLLWRGFGKYQHLYRFVAARCLGNGDSAIPVEGVHSRWQRLEREKAALKLVQLNALLKLHYCLHEGRAVIDVDELVPLVQTFRSAHATEYKLVLEHGEVPKGMRQDVLYLDRFNLHARQSQLLDADLDTTHTSSKQGKRDREALWEVYCRKLFEPMHFYSFCGLSPDLFFCVMGTRAFQSREQLVDNDNSCKVVAVSWFEKVDCSLDGGIRVRRVCTSTRSLSVEHQTMEQLVLAAGLGLPTSHDSVRHGGCLLQFLNHELTHFESAHETMADHGGDGSDAYQFLLRNPLDIEARLWSTTEARQMTKLALSRRLHLSMGLDMWRAYESMSKDGMIAALLESRPLPRLKRAKKH